MRQGLVQGQHSIGFEQLKARNGKLAAHVEELVLNFHQEFTHAVGHVLAEQNANVRVELVHIAHGMHTQAVFGHALVVAQARRACVARAGGDLCESIAHAENPQTKTQLLRQAQSVAPAAFAAYAND